MVASTGATVSTLLFLAHQNRQIQKTNSKQQQVTEAQLAATNFEQYVNHRRFFAERLTELEITFGNSFKFEKRESLYNKIFPNNSPTNLEFTAKVDSSIDNQNYLGKLNSILTKLDDFSRDPDWKNSGARRLIGLLIDLNEALDIRMINEAYDGDVNFSNSRTAINIYSPEEFIGIARTIYNSFMFYTGNPKLPEYHAVMGRSASDSLMEFFLRNTGASNPSSIVKVIPGLALMEKIYFNLYEIDLSHFQFMQPSYGTLVEAFASREAVMRLRDRLLVEHLAESGCEQTSKALAHAPEDDTHFDLLKDTNELFLQLLSISRSTRTQSDPA